MQNEITAMLNDSELKGMVRAQCMVLSSDCDCAVNDGKTAILNVVLSR